MEKPNWRQSMRSTFKKLGRRDYLTYAGVASIYIGALVMMIILPIKLIPQTTSTTDTVDPNVVSNGNYLPAKCTLYTVLADGSGLPLSEGPLILPFQRPSADCRTFTSSAMEKLIGNITGRMVDKDLARLFENAFPNTLGGPLIVLANGRYNGVLVQSRRYRSSGICHHR
jgi:hypothetical protein